MIYLEAYFSNDQLVLACHDSNETLYQRERSQASRDLISQYSHQMTERLNESMKMGDDSSKNIEEIQANGRILYDSLLTKDCRDKLSSTNATYLIVSMDDQLVHLHWELIFDGEQFLCQRFNMGRIVHTSDQIAKGRRRNLENKTIQMGIIADPNKDLRAADQEGKQIFINACRMNRSKNMIQPALEPNIKHEKLTYKLKKYDIFHFAGHATYDASRPENCGWRLSDKIFSTNDIHKMSASSAMPSLIFSNACQSARTSDLIEKQNKSLLGLANAFLFAGVNHYLGSTWSIPDDSSAQFAYEFYTHLFQGKSIGESVKLARAYFVDNNQNNFIWTSYILYGDPRYTYFTKDEKIQKKIKFKPSVYHKRTLRGLFNYAWDTDQLIKKMIFILLFIGIVGGIGLGYLYLSYLKTQKIHKQLVNQAYQHQQRVDRLTKEFCQKWPDSFHYSKASPDGWTSTQLPVAMMFDSHQFIQGRENLILFALQDEMLEQLTFIKLLERKSIDKLLEEWIKADIKPALSLPKLIIFLEVHKDVSKTYVLMRLVENWDQVIDNLFEEISSGNIFSQKKKLSKQLIQTLIERYPIKGLISKKNDDDYLLNIGSIEGVRPGQTFKEIDSNKIFTVMSVGLKSSIMAMKSGESLSAVRLKVIRLKNNLMEETQ